MVTVFGGGWVLCCAAIVLVDSGEAVSANKLILFRWIH